MAVAKYGAIVTDIKGKIGGTVFQGSVAGGVMKNNAARKSTSGTSKLSKADAGRAFLPQRTIAELSSAWKTLSSGDQLSWKTAAPGFPFTNKFGVQYTPSGFQLYMSVNTNLTVIGQSVMSSAPTPSDLINMPAFGLTWTSAGQLSITNPAGVPSGYFMQVYGTVGMSAGRQPQKGDYKLLAVYPDSAVFPLNIDTEYSTVFGSYSTGATVWIQCKLSKADSGRNSQPFVGPVIVP